MVHSLAVFDYFVLFSLMHIADTGMIFLARMMENTHLEGEVPEMLFSLPQLQKVWVSVILLALLVYSMLYGCCYWYIV